MYCYRRVYNHSFFCYNINGESMKKVLLFLSLFLIFIPNVFAKEKVTISVFYSKTCIHCTHLHEYLDNLEQDSKYGEMINIDYYEVNEKENSEIFNKVLAYFKRQSSGVPFYVIGSKYEVGFPNPETMEKEYNETDAKIKKLIEEEYKNNKKTNIVKDIINEKVKVTTTEKSTLPLVEDDTKIIEPANEKTKSKKLILYMGIPSTIIVLIVIILTRRKEA